MDTAIKDKILQLRKGRAGILKKGHLWVYKNQFLKTVEPIKGGEIVSLLGPGGEFIGRGYYNPRSEIRLRLLSFSKEDICQSLFDKRIADAESKRADVAGMTNAYRVVFSEADLLPGLIVDRYAETIVFQVLTLGMERLKEMAVEAIKAILKPRYIYEKSVSPFRKLEGLNDVKMWWGDKGDTTVEIYEGKVKFLVDIEHGHKTGFYLDQRKSRQALHGLVKDKSVLDLFSYTGGFSVSAASFGAKYVRSVDIKDEWLKLGAGNAKLNDVSDKITFIKNDSFSELDKLADEGKMFDIVVLDPPSFIKSKKDIESASKGYRELNLKAMKILNDGGILATFSCSHYMPNDIFSLIIKKAAQLAGKRFEILKRCHQAKDHPIVKAMPETEYLKGYFLKIYSENKE